MLEMQLFAVSFQHLTIDDLPNIYRGRFLLIAHSPACYGNNTFCFVGWGALGKTPTVKRCHGFRNHWPTS